MNYDPTTIEDQIECLARLTGAPNTFVDQVKCLFSQKGIELDSDAGPFLHALEEAFRREERIRTTTFRARENLADLNQNFQKVGQAYVRQLSQLKTVQSNLREQERRLRRNSRGSNASRSTQISIQGDHRTYVTKPVSEELPMVPGPKEIQ